MIQYLAYIWLHFAICFLLFMFVQRPAFIVYNRRTNSQSLSATDVAQIYKAGFQTDLIAASYLTIPVFLVLWLHILWPVFNLAPVLTIVEAIIAFAFTLATAADTALYSFWRFKLDSSVFVYLKSPKEAFASVSPLYIVVAIVALAVLSLAVFFLFCTLPHITDIENAKAITGVWARIGVFFIFVLNGGLLFVFIRGLHHHPYNPYMTLYSNNTFYNHCALNPLYSLIYSFSINGKVDTQFNFMDSDQCNSEVRAMFPTSGKPSVELLNTPNPNILFIVWESLFAGYVEPLGGRKGVTANFNKLCDEGVLFTNVAASSFRTERALPSIFSGLPGQPTYNAILNTRLLPMLPALPRSLGEKGYTSTHVYGGNIKIMHMNDYHFASGCSKVLSVDDFPEGSPRFSWGIHDNYMCDRVCDMVIEQSKSPNPWMISFLTQSSHQPYIVPFNKFSDPIANAYAFADDAVGRMIQQIKDSPAWSNLLIVIVGDHGLNVTSEPLTHKKHSHVPLLLLGGAVKQPMKIDTIMSQTDIAATLLGQMGIDHHDYVFSRDVLANTYTDQFSFHTYNNGFVVTDSAGHTDFDNTAMRAIEGADENRERRGRMILQSLYDYLRNILK